MKEMLAPRELKTKCRKNKQNKGEKVHRQLREREDANGHDKSKEQIKKSLKMKTHEKKRKERRNKS